MPVVYLSTKNRNDVVNTVAFAPISGLMCLLAGLTVCFIFTVIACSKGSAKVSLLSCRQVEKILEYEN